MNSIVNIVVGIVSFLLMIGILGNIIMARKENNKEKRKKHIRMARILLVIIFIIFIIYGFARNIM